MHVDFVNPFTPLCSLLLKNLKINLLHSAVAAQSLLGRIDKHDLPYLATEVAVYFYNN